MFFELKELNVESKLETISKRNTSLIPQDEQM